MPSETLSAAIATDSMPADPEAPRRATVRSPRRRDAVLGGALYASAAAFAAAAWRVAQEPPYTSGSAAGYALGLIGGLTLLALLAYPVRKHARCLQPWGRLKHWFAAHMVGGILGPLLILFHSTFRVGSFNAAVALGCMLLVVASGLTGRFLYRRVHHGLYGRRATLAEAAQALQQQLPPLDAALRATPRLREEVERYVAFAAAAPSGWLRRARHFALLGVTRRLALRRIRRGAGERHVGALAQQIDRTLRAAQEAAQFATYEKLFGLWHVVHIPFLCLLVVTALIHVVAVHAY